MLCLKVQNSSKQKKCNSRNSAKVGWGWAQDYNQGCKVQSQLKNI